MHLECKENRCVPIELICLLQILHAATQVAPQMKNVVQIVAKSGATVGDFLYKPVSNGGLALSRPIASVAIGAFMIVCIFVLPQRAGRHPGQSKLAS